MARVEYLFCHHCETSEHLMIRMAAALLVGLVVLPGCESNRRVIGEVCGQTLYCHGHVDKTDGTWDCLFVEKVVLCRSEERAP